MSYVFVLAKHYSPAKFCQSTQSSAQRREKRLLGGFTPVKQALEMAAPGICTQASVSEYRS